MKGWTVKKIILRCFFATGLFYLHEKFQLWQSSPSHFFIKKMAFFIIFVGKIFFLQNIYGFTPVKKILSHLDQKWAQTKQLLSKKFQLPIAMEGCIVHWSSISCSLQNLMVGFVEWTFNTSVMHYELHNSALCTIVSCAGERRSACGWDSSSTARITGVAHPHTGRREESESIS